MRSPPLLITFGFPDRDSGTDRCSSRSLSIVAVRVDSRRFSRVEQTRGLRARLAEFRRRTNSMLPHRQRAREWQADVVANKWALRSASGARVRHHRIPPPLSQPLFPTCRGASVELHSDFSITITDIVPLTLTLLTLILSSFFKRGEYVDFWSHFFFYKISDKSTFPVIE